MAGQNPTLIVRVAATIEELRKNLAEGKNQIETTTAAMNKLASSFSGDRLIQAAHNVTAAVNQIGGVSKLTEAEMARVNATLEKALDKYRVLGKEAPAGIQALANATRRLTDETIHVANASENWTSVLDKANQLLGLFGVGLSIGALVSFTKGLFDDADALEKLHDKTDISIEDLQRLRSIGDEAGVSIDSITDAATKLQMRLGKGDAGANGALAELQINAQEFLRLNAAAQFFAIANAVDKLDDPLTRARVLSELYGKSWAEMVPALKAAVQGHQQDVFVMSRESTKAIDALGDAVASYWRQFKAIAGESLADVLTLSLSSTRELTSEFSAMIEAVKPLHDALAPPGLPADLDEINRKFEKQAETLSVIAKFHKEAAEKLAEYRKAKADQISEGMKNEVAALNTLYTLERENAEAEMKLTMTDSEFKLFKIEEEAQARKNAWSGPQEFAAQYFAQVDTWAKRQVDQVLAGTKQIEQEWVTLIGVVNAANQAMAGGHVLTNNLRPSSLLREQTNQRSEYFRQAGGPVMAGSPYMVGERGPELFVPERSGTILPHGSMSPTIIVNIHGSVLSDERKIAEAVGGALVGQLRGLGVRLPARV